MKMPGAGDGAQWLEAFVVLVEDPGSDSRSIMECTIVIPVPRQPVLSSGLNGHCMHAVHTHTCNNNTHTPNKNKILRKSILKHYTYFAI